MTPVRQLELNPPFVQGSVDPTLRMLQQQQQDHPSLGEELRQGDSSLAVADGRPTSLQLSYDSPVTEQPVSSTVEDPSASPDAKNNSR